MAAQMFNCVHQECFSTRFFLGLVLRDCVQKFLYLCARNIVSSVYEVPTRSAVARGLHWSGLHDRNNSDAGCFGRAICTAQAFHH